MVEWVDAVAVVLPAMSGSNPHCQCVISTHCTVCCSVCCTPIYYLYNATGHSSKLPRTSPLRYDMTLASMHDRVAGSPHANALPAVRLRRMLSNYDINTLVSSPSGCRTLSVQDDRVGPPNNNEAPRAYNETQPENSSSEHFVVYPQRIAELLTWNSCDATGPPSCTLAMVKAGCARFDWFSRCL